jgi:hypothetical protein
MKGSIRSFNCFLAIVFALTSGEVSQPAGSAAKVLSIPLSVLLLRLRLSRESQHYKPDPDSALVETCEKRPLIRGHRLSVVSHAGWLIAVWGIILLIRSPLMKQCPECKKAYADETLNYCLDDGASLVDGPVTDNSVTAILTSSRTAGEAPTRTFGSSDTIKNQLPLRPRRNRSARFLQKRGTR